VIGDITCDPEGAIQFSRETWIDNPVFTYYPADDHTLDGILPDGISVMAVTNLPCEFSADASVHFGREIQPLLMSIAAADYDAPSPADAGLPMPAIQATILWQGAFTPPYTYMQAFVQDA
jgi:hypothetical protein